MKKSIFLFFSLLHAFFTYAQVTFVPLNVKDAGKAIVYVGITNTFRIKAPQDISIKDIQASQGNIRMKDDNTMLLYVHDESLEPLIISYIQVKNGTETKVEHPIKYTIKKVPDYFQLQIGEYTESGEMSMKSIKQNAKFKLCDDEYNGIVPPYQIKLEQFVQPLKGDPYENSCTFNSDNYNECPKMMENFLKSLKIGDKVFFENIYINTEDGTSRKAKDRNFKIVE